MSPPTANGLRLLSPLGRGGMGQVWSARRERDGVSCAVKLLSDAPERTTEPWRAMRREIRAMAALDHAHIVRILDWGELDAPLEGIASEGSPYIAMELLDGGSLEGRVLDWPRARMVLGQVLQALGHAHARGVLHRDLKPGNVLLTDHSAGALAKLTDFGIAQTRTDGLEERGQVSGTPAFMPPEQRQGRWRAQGPWTDLFALGKVALALLAGPRGEMVLVPHGFEAWVGRLIAPDPGHRYDRAADALEDLLALGSAATLYTPNGASTADETVSWTALDHPADEESPQLSTPVARPPVRRQFPEDWSAKPAFSDGLPPVGPRVVPLRQAPPVGRTVEQHRLWNVLSAVWEEQGPRVLTLTGPAGVGVEALATWFTARADELGAATVLEARRAGDARSGAALGAALAEHLHLEGLSRGDARIDEAVRLWCTDERFARRVVRGLRDPRTSSGPGARAAWSRLFSLWARRRPLVLWLHDVAADPLCAALVSELAGHDSLAVLILLTGDAPTVEQGEVIELPRLNRSALLRLANGMTELHPETAHALADGADGLPDRLVTELLTQLRTSALDATPQGWRHRSDLYASTGLPPTLERLGPAAGAMLVYVALRGARVTPARWARLCALAGLEIEAPDEVLVAAGLARERPGGWSLTPEGQQMVVGRAATSQRREVHRALAGALHEEGRVREAAHHAVAGEAWEDAVPWLIEAFGRANGAEERSEARRYRDGLAVAADALNVEPDSPLRGQVWLMDAQLAMAEGRLDDVMQAARRISERRATPGWRRLADLAQWVHGRVLIFLGRFEEARAQLVEVLERGEIYDDTLVRARATFDLGQIAMHTGEHARAEAYLEAARGLYDAIGHRGGASISALFLSHELVQRGALAEAEVILADLEAIQREHGLVFDLAETLMHKGDLFEKRGRPDEAIEILREAARLRPTGWVTMCIRVNLALVLNRAGRHREAGDALVGVHEPLERWGRRRMLAAAHFAALAPAVARMDPDAFDHHLEAGEALLGDGERNSELASSARLAAGLASREGWHARGERALALAVRLKDAPSTD